VAVKLVVSARSAALLADGTTLTANVISVDPRVDPASQSIRVVLEFDNPNGSIRAGSAISVSSP
ncbi:MAG: efflux transporter periplasmic adaptor subunit, partial [Pseudomonadota bacterium]